MRVKGAKPLFPAAKTFIGYKSKKMTLTNYIFPIFEIIAYKIAITEMTTMQEMRRLVRKSVKMAYVNCD